MKLSRRDPYRQRRQRHPIVLVGWLAIILLVLLLGLSWWNGGERPMTEIELPVSAEQLAG